MNVIHLQLSKVDVLCFHNKVMAEVLKRANHKRSLKNEIMLRKTKYLGHALRKNGMQRGLLESNVVGGRGRGRPRHTWLHNIRKEMGVSYVDLVRTADD